MRHQQAAPQRVQLPAAMKIKILRNSELVCIRQSYGHTFPAAAPSTGAARHEWWLAADLHSTQTSATSGFARMTNFHQAGKLVAGIGELKGDRYGSRGGGHGLRSQ